MLTADKNAESIFFLRLYVGAQSKLNEAIIKLLKVSFKQHAAEFLTNQHRNEPALYHE